MSRNSTTSLGTRVCKEAVMMLFALVFASIPFVAATQAEESPAAQVSVSLPLA